MRFYKTIYLTGFCLIVNYSFGQVDTSFQRFNLGLAEYLNRVSTNNLGYIAEKFNLSISDAGVEKAKVFQDFSLSLDYTQSKEDGSNSGYSISSELGKTINLAGKRRARIDLALSENQLAKALVEDYFRNLQAEAAILYMEALKQNQLLRVKIDSYQTIKKLSDADSIRFSIGNIMEIDAAQSKVEAGILLNELQQAEAEWRNALNQIALMVGNEYCDSILFPTGSLKNTLRAFVLSDLITSAVNNRTDLQVAMKNKEVSQRLLRLTRKERRMDIDLKLGLENSYLPAGGSPAATGITAGIAIPLKLSNLNRGEIKIAQYQIEQADILYKQAELQVKHEVIQAYNLYIAYCKQVDSFDNGLLKNARNVKRGKIYSYERGETSLLEVLNAQRTYNEIQVAYHEALFNRAAALVELEKAAGIWDISL
ncbi:MAG: TolC family protein [Bacteroidales bacterium]|nr:MAG: TolC family protein [Bacteroidales bacterium]